MMQIVDRRKLDETIEVFDKPVSALGNGDNVYVIGQKPINEKSAAKNTWKDVAFMIAFLNVNGSQVVSGRAVGLRSDGRAFVADYLFSPVWERGFEWTAVAECRLDTFLNCECKDGLACEMHEKTCRQWLIEGVERLQSVGSQGVPEAVEAFMRAQQQNPRIIAPGR